MKCPYCGKSFDTSPGLFADDQLKRMSRRDQPITSRMAAEKVMRSMSETLQKVGHVLHKFGPMTDRELHLKCCSIYGERAESSYRKRRTDLTERGHCYDTGVTKVDDDGERRVLWALTNSGHMIFGSDDEGTA